MLGRPVLASDLEGFSVGNDRLFHGGRMVDEGLGSGGDARRLAEPVEAPRICDFGMLAGEGAGDQIQRPIECGEDGELGRVDEIVRSRHPIDLPAARWVSPGHSRDFFGRRASASRRR